MRVCPLLFNSQIHALIYIIDYVMVCFYILSMVSIYLHLRDVVTMCLCVLFSSERPSSEGFWHEMGQRRAGSGGRAVGRTDLQVCGAVNGRLETAAEELSEKVRAIVSVRVSRGDAKRFGPICAPDRRNSVKTIT